MSSHRCGAGTDAMDRAPPLKSVTDPRLEALAGDARAALALDRDGGTLLWRNAAAEPLLGSDGAPLLASEMMHLAPLLAKPGAVQMRHLQWRSDSPGVPSVCRLLEREGEPPLILVQALHAVTDPSGALPASGAVDNAPLSRPVHIHPSPVASEGAGWRWLPNDPDATEADKPQRLAHSGGSLPGLAIRFVFRTDAGGRFTAVSPALALSIGIEGAAWTGKTWTEIAAAAGLLQDTAVARALADRRTWTGCLVAWPVPTGQPPVTLELGAVPEFDASRTFQGFRGFGVSRGSTPALSLVTSSSTLQAPVTTALPSPTDPRPERRDGSKVVRLHGMPGAPSSGGAVGPTPDHTSERGAGLSPSERSAFQEIARVLGVRLEGGGGGGPTEPVADPEIEVLPPAAPGVLEPQPSGVDSRDPLPASADQPPAKGVIEVSADGRQPDRSRAGLLRPDGLVDALPTAVLVGRGDRPLFVNRVLAGRLPPEDSDELDRLKIERQVAPDGLVWLTLDRQGQPVVRLLARGRTIAWDDGEAELFAATVVESLPAEPVASPPADDGSELLRRAAAAEAAADAASRRADELQTVLDTATDGVLILDAEGRIAMANRGTEALFGYEPGALDGEPFARLVAPESQAAADAYLAGLRGAAPMLDGGRDIVGQARQGGTVPLFLTVGRLGETDGRYGAVLRDLTSAKRAADDLTAARQRAEQAVEEAGETALSRLRADASDRFAGLAQELRAPLSRIVAAAESMLEERFGPLGNERYKASMRDIATAGEHVIGLLGDLSDLSRLEAGRFELNPSSVSLNDVMGACVAIMQPQASRDRIIIRTSLSAGLPPVMADGRSIRQVALTLLANSIRLTMPGGQVIVSTSLSERGEAVLRIRDTGVGLTERELASALDPFRGGSEALAAAVAGGGLGLPLTRALVEANQAGFSISSSRNAGTIVEIVFPAGRVLAD